MIATTPAAYDVVVVGGGVLGLWIAKDAVDRGMHVALIERATCGRAASATPLGALMPHLPGPLDDKKAFQLAALMSLPKAIDDLEAATGRTCGYRALGRIIPIHKATFAAKAETTVTDAHTHWPEAAARRAAFEIVPRADVALPGSYLADTATPFGVLRDTLSAAVDASALTTALRHSVASRADVYEATEFGNWDSRSGCVQNVMGRTITTAKACVIAAGTHTFPLLEAAGLDTLGDGIKGQAATFAFDAPVFETGTDSALPPILYDNGIYVIATSPTTAAVGTTTEYDWEVGDPDTKTAEPMLGKAMALSPILREGTRTRLWAGIRPRAASRAPLVGPLDGTGLYVATGGYKITFGIAHALASGLVSEIAGDTGGMRLPERFLPELAGRAGSAAAAAAE